jgi:hypothetical protein
MDQLFAGKHFGEAHGSGAVDQRERYAGRGIILPDKLEHQELVKIGVEQGTGDRIEFPVVVVRPLGEVYDHDLTIINQDPGLRPWRYDPGLVPQLTISHTFSLLMAVSILCEHSQKINRSYRWVAFSWPSG